MGEDDPTRHLRGKRVTVMGLGRFGGGVGAARWLARQGALVTVTDQADAPSLAHSLAQLEKEPIARYRLGGHHPDDFLQADLVVVNPAVRPGNRFLRMAASAGVPKTTEIGLYLARSPAQRIAVTGTTGKSTTAAMTAAVLRTAGRRTWLGGNLGGSLLDHLEETRPGDWAVLELSSFQLWHLQPGTLDPRIAVVTNLAPNHLDWHGDYEHYVAAKQRILAGQSPDRQVVLNPEDRQLDGWAHRVRGRGAPVISDAEIPPLAVPGDHNRANARLAATAAAWAGCPREAIQQGLASFAGLPERLQRVAVIAGRSFYNDTAATTPESTAAALRSLPAPLWLLAGGGDKGVPFGRLADAVVAHAAGAAFFGSTGARLLQQVRQRAPSFPATARETLDQAFAWCWDASRPGDSVVLSPACSSHDQYPNYRQRGEHFMQLVRALADPRQRR